VVARKKKHLRARSLATIEDVMGEGWPQPGVSREEMERGFGLLAYIHRKQSRGDVLPDRFAHLETGVTCFIEYVLVDEVSGAQVVNGHHHVEWQHFLDRNRFAVIMAPVGHGKTQQIIGRALYTLGKNPSTRIGMICGTEDQAIDRVQSIGQHIIGNSRLHEIFPDLKPSSDPRDSWSSREITVERKTVAKDPSVRAFGANSSKIQGARLDKIIMDDVLDEKNTRTPEARKKVLKWFDVKVFTRLPPDGSGSVEVIGTPWHSEDLLHVLSERKTWGSQVWSAVLNPDDPQEEWEALWPEVVTVERLISLANTILSNAFMRKYCCRSRNEETARFQLDWIQNAFWLGRNKRMLDRKPRIGRAGRALPCFTGVDLGIGQREEHDLSVIFTAALRPDNKRQVIDIQSGRWTGPEIVQRIIRTQLRFDSRVIVESNAAQKYITQFTIDQGIPVEAFHTGRNKHDENYGVESIAIEMRAGLWIFPANEQGEANDSELRMLSRGMLDYTPTDHTSDHLMAMWFVRESIRSHLAREEADGRLVDIQYR